MIIEQIMESYSPEQRINLAEMKQRHAERQADMYAIEYMKIVEKNNKLMVELIKLRLAASRLYSSVYAKAGYPRNIAITLQEEGLCD